MPYATRNSTAKHKKSDQELAESDSRLTDIDTDADISTIDPLEPLEAESQAEESPIEVPQDVRQQQSLPPPKSGGKASSFIPSKSSPAEKKKTKVEVPPTSDRKKDTSHALIVSLLIALFAMIAAYLSLDHLSSLLTSETPDHPSERSKWLIVSDHIKKRRILERFQNSVADISLDIFERAIKNSIELSERNSNKLEPLVMLVVSARSNRNSTCFLEEIKGIFQKVGVNRPIEIDGSTSSPEAIHHLEDQFEEDSTELAIIKSIDQMDHQAFLKIHKYANHDDSVHRKLILILTVHSELVHSLRPKSSLREIEEVTHDILSKAYESSMGHDSVEKMASRLTDKPIVLLTTGSGKYACD